MLWLNEPPQWGEQDGVLSVTTGEKTDFWRQTHNGLTRDDGHFRDDRVDGDFTASVEFHGDYREPYDQAGLMLRLDANNWIKAGIELVDGHPLLSVVVTRDFSDWSTRPLPVAADWLRLSLTRRRSTIRVEWATEAMPADLSMLRLAYLPDASPVLVGPMGCSPKRAGFQAKFRDFAVTATETRDLHG
jgi:regulation of enolase protein 1 (concanavalin A-like superfamily)